MLQEKKKRRKNKKPSAMAQVHNRVNAGVMDAVAYGGMMEAAEPEDDEYELAMEPDGPSNYGHAIDEKKTMYITEDQMRQIKLLLEADDRIKKVNKIIDAEFSNLLNLDSPVSGQEYYVNGNPQTTWRQYLLFSLRHTFGLMTNADVQYLPVVARFAFSNEVGFEKRNDNGTEVSKLQKVVGLLKTDKELFAEIKANPSITFGQLYTRLEEIINAQDAADAEAANKVVARNDYDILDVPDFKTANYYGNHSCSGSRLCYTQGENTWNNYTSNGKNRVYVCLKHGWENIPEEHGPGDPYDEYGTSMIFVFIDENGNIAYSNCRWNHETFGEYNGSVDHAFTKKSLSETVGVPFDSVFKPYSDEYLAEKGIYTVNLVQKKLDSVLASGGKLEDIFKDVIEIDENFTRNGIYKVYFAWNNKNYYSFDEDDFNDWAINLVKDGKLLFKEWLESVSGPQAIPNTNMSCICVRTNPVGYSLKVINSDGLILSDAEFTMVDAFSPQGLARVAINDKQNFLKCTGGFLFDKWYPSLGLFRDGLAECYPNGWGAVNLINMNGEFVSDRCFVRAYFSANVQRYEEGTWVVEREDGKKNFVKDGKIASPIWFHEINGFRDGLAVVGICTGNTSYEYEYNYVKENGELLSETWFWDAGAFREGLAAISLPGTGKTSNFIKTDGTFLSKEWFDDTGGFKDGFAKVRNDSGDKVIENLIDRNGNLVSEQWFDEISVWKTGTGNNAKTARLVILNGKENLVADGQGLYSNVWFDEINPMSNPYTYLVFGTIDDRWYGVFGKEKKLLSDGGYDNLTELLAAYKAWSKEKEEQQPINESTDSVRALGLHCNDDNAIPFISFIDKEGKSTKIFVGKPAHLHSILTTELVLNGEIKKEDFGSSLWDIKRNEEKSGRIWFLDDYSVISFYSYPNSLSQISKNCLDAIYAVKDALGEEYPQNNFVVDYWTHNHGNGHYLIPLRWFNNGTAEVFLPYMKSCLPSKSFSGDICFKLETTKGKFTLDWSGDDVDSESPYGWTINESMERKFDYKKYIKSFIDFLHEQGLKIDPLPEIELKNDEQDGLFIKTGYYSPDEMKVVAYVNGRHPKDVMRTVAHEFVHHMQNLENPNKDWSGGGDLEEDSKLRAIEGEAFLLGNILFREWTEKMKRAGLNESKGSVDEIAYEMVEPDDVDLSSFNIKKHLNPKFWEDGHLDTRIRLKLLDIADDFFDSLGVDWVEPEDVIMTGSLANYNWNEKYSDIDLHVLVDYEDVDERADFVREYFAMKKNQWNEKHKKLKIFGFPVEVYVQDVNEPHASSGVYSVDKDKWLTEPDLENLRSGHVDKKHIREMVSTYMNKIDGLIDIYKTHKDDEYEMEKVYEDASDMMDEIKELRRGDLKKYGREMCDGNLIFKALRRSDYIGKLIKLKDLAYDKINSL